MSNTDNYLRTLLITTSGAALKGAYDAYQNDNKHFFKIKGTLPPTRRYFTRGEAKRQKINYRSGPTQAPSMPHRFVQHVHAKGSKFRSNLGRRPGKYASRRRTAQGSELQLDDKTLKTFKLIDIPFNASDAIINTRKSNLVKVTGVKLRIQFGLQSRPFDNATTGTPIIVRWAIINPKENTGDSTFNSNKFFITKNPVDNMAQDFPDGVGSQFVYLNRKINREQFGVLREGQMTLVYSDGGARGIGTASGAKYIPSKHSFNCLNIYLPINRQMRFENDLVTNPTENLYFCYWFVGMGDEQTNRLYTIENTPLKEFHESTTYFRNSAMYS